MLTLQPIFKYPETEMDGFLSLEELYAELTKRLKQEWMCALKTACFEINCTHQNICWYCCPATVHLCREEGMPWTFAPDLWAPCHQNLTQDLALVWLSIIYSEIAALEWQSTEILKSGCGRLPVSIKMDDLEVNFSASKECVAGEKHLHSSWLFLSPFYSQHGWKI